MAITASAKITAVDFITEEDQKSDNPTIWKVRPLDGQQYMGIMAEANSDDDGMMSFSERTMKKTLKYGFIGWSNFSDEDGKAIKFSQMSFGRVPVTELTKIFSEIIRLSSLSEDEAKN